MNWVLNFDCASFKFSVFELWNRHFVTYMRHYSADFLCNYVALYSVTAARTMNLMSPSVTLHAASRAALFWLQFAPNRFSAASPPHNPALGQLTALRRSSAGCIYRTYFWRWGESRGRGREFSLGRKKEKSAPIVCRVGLGDSPWEAPTRPAYVSALQSDGRHWWPIHTVDPLFRRLASVHDVNRTLYSDERVQTVAPTQCTARALRDATRRAVMWIRYKVWVWARLTK